MVSTAFCVLDALLAVRTVTVHDCENHVSLEMLDEGIMRDAFMSFRHLKGSLHISPSGYLHCLI